MNNIMVSINCLTYNHEKFIADALDSFIMQRVDFEYEILIHDDASTDKTADIIRMYEEKYPNLINAIYQSENLQSKGVKICVAEKLCLSIRQYFPGLYRRLKQLKGMWAT